VLVEAAAQRQVLTYGEVAPRIDAGLPIVVRHALHPIYLLCAEKGWPHLTGIVVNATTRRPGAGFRFWQDDELEARWTEVFDYNWAAVPAPFAPGVFARPRQSPTTTDYSVPDQWVETNGRGPYQDAFRKQLLRIYGSRCALCDTRLKELLIASHIVPWSQDHQNRCNPRNGILLCRSHDALFEHGIVRINPDLTVATVLPDGVAIGATADALLRSQTASHVAVAQASWAPDPSFLEKRLGLYESADGVSDNA